jgi:hypothetical protein
MENTKVPGRGLLITSCIIMLVSALPLMLWTFTMIYSTSPYDAPGDDLASLGCFFGAATYLWSVLPAVFGLAYSKKPHRYKCCRALGWITVTLLLACVVMQRVVFLFTTLPLAIMTTLYLIAAYAPKRREHMERREQNGSEQG